MKRLLATALLAVLTATTVASAQEAPISKAQLQKMQKYLQTVGTKTTFPAPTAASLGLSSDVSQLLPVVMTGTSDQTIYFCRSELNPADYIVWVRVANDKTASYMFSTHADFKMMRALYLRAEKFPQPVDTNSSEVQTVYKKALAELAEVIDRSAPPEK